MRTLNRVTLLGNAAGDPETRHSASGTAVTNLSIATTNKWQDKDTGEWKEKGEFHRCVMFGKLSDIVDEYVHKGMQLFVEGRLQTRSWEKDGVKKYATEIVVSDLQMLGSRSASKPATDGSDKNKPDWDKEFNDDIPF